MVYRAAALLAAVCAVLVVATPSFAADPAPVLPDMGGQLVAPDAETASDVAADTGQPVLVADEITPTVEVAAEPSGNFAAEITAAPARVEDPTSPSGWTDIDLDLIATTSGYAPRHAASNVTFGPGGDTTFATVAGAGWSLRYTWPVPLPPPVIAGATATYADVLPDTDLVLRATAEGFAKTFVVRSRPVQSLTFRIGVAAVGVTLRPVAGGRRSFRRRPRQRTGGRAPVERDDVGRTEPARRPWRRASGNGGHAA